MLKSTMMQSSMKMVLLESEAGQIFDVGADDGYRRSLGRAKHLIITGEMTLQWVTWVARRAREITANLMDVLQGALPKAQRCSKSSPLLFWNISHRVTRQVWSRKRARMTVLEFSPNSFVCRSPYAIGLLFSSTSYCWYFSESRSMRLPSVGTASTAGEKVWQTCFVHLDVSSLVTISAVRVHVNRGALSHDDFEFRACVFLFLWLSLHDFGGWRPWCLCSLSQDGFREFVPALTASV